MNAFQAMDHIQKAVKADPSNRTYQQLYRLYRQGEQTYQSNAQDFNTDATDVSKICLELCMARMCCYGCI